MTQQIAIRLDTDELAALDLEVVQGRAGSRTEAVRRSITRLQREQRYRAEEALLVELARQGRAVYPDLNWDVDLPHPTLD